MLDFNDLLNILIEFDLTYDYEYDESLSSGTITLKNVDSIILYSQDECSISFSVVCQPDIAASVYYLLKERYNELVLNECHYYSFDKKQITFGDKAYREFVKFIRRDAKDSLIFKQRVDWMFNNQKITCRDC